MEITQSSSKWRLFAFGLMLAGLGMLALSLSPAPANAADEPFKLEFDQSEMQLGLLSDLPLGELASTASIEGTISPTGVVKVPKDGFKLPTIGIEEPVKVSAFMGIEEDATGTFNQETGELVINAKAGVWISVNLAELLSSLEGLGVDLGDQLGSLSGIISSVGELTCGFAPMDVSFTTGETSLGAGAPFTKGTLGPGTVTAEWGQLGPFAGRTKILGFLDACQIIRDYAPTLLEGALGGVLPEGLDLGGLDIATLLANLDNVNLGPSSLTLIRSVDENPIVEPPATTPDLKLSVTPKQHKVKAGKKAVFTVKVRNTGDGAAKGVKVCLKSPGDKVIKTKRCRTLGTVMPGATQTRRFQVKIKSSSGKRKVKVGFQFSSSNAKRGNASARLLIRR